MNSESREMQPLDILSLRDHIEQRITAAILDGTYRPGERLIESAIAEKLGVSRAPVREALTALEGEGIVVQQPRRGYYVVDFTRQDINALLTASSNQVFWFPSFLRAFRLFATTFQGGIESLRASRLAPSLSKPRSAAVRLSLRAWPLIKVVRCSPCHGP